VKILDRYIGSRLARGVAVVLFVLVCLFSFLELVVQLDDIGTGSYQLEDAVAFVVLTLPRRMLDFLPVSTLLGGVIALGLLADKGELLAMQASGVSLQRICLSVLATGTLLMLATGVFAEFIAPPMEQRARVQRSLVLSDTGILLTKRGFWACQGPSFIRVGKTLYGKIASDIDIYKHDEEGRLQVFTHAREADIQDNKQWLLKDIDQKIITEKTITTRHLSSLTLESFLSPEQIRILKLPPDSLSPSDLYHYVRALEAGGQNADHYVLALWQKLSIPLTTGAMILLSLPFVFGRLDVMTAGHRIMLGSIVGIVFYLANKIIGYLGLLFGLNPAFTTLAPVAAVFWVAIWLLRRVW